MQSSNEIKNIRHQQTQMIVDIQDQIFRYLQLQQNYEVNQIKINDVSKERIKTIFIRSNIETKRVFYLGHGFGGTSLMYFPILRKLLEKGHIVLWQIRGMGLINKIQYLQLPDKNIMAFYKEGVLKVLQFYKHQQIVFISHSFGAYITLRFLLKYAGQYNIQKCILLSAIGITPKLNDYKLRCNTLSDKFYYIYSWLGWTFNITYKSLLKKLNRPLKLKLLKKFFSKYQLNEMELQLICKLFDVLSHLQGGSDKYFFQAFEPRVLPKFNNSIQQLIQNSSFKFETVFYYGGQADWVDKQGSYTISKKNDKIYLKILNTCCHMLPLHVKQIQEAFQKQFQNI